MSISELISEIIYYISHYGCTTRNYQPNVAREIDKAVEYKRRGLYQDSLEVYLKIISSEKIAHTGVLNGLFKVVACAGYLRQTKIILQIGDITMKNSNTVYNPFGLPNNFEEHYHRLKDAISSEESLYIYLKSISGNSNYSMPKSYTDMLLDYMKWLRKDNKKYEDEMFLLC